MATSNKKENTSEDEGKISVGAIKQIAAVVGALGVIVGAVLTVDSRYAKPEDIEKARFELTQSIDDMHKDILETEQLRIMLGDSVKANKILLDKNKRDLAEVQNRLDQSVAAKVTVAPVRVKASAPAMLVQPETEEINVNTSATVHEPMSAEEPPATSGSKKKEETLF